MNPAFNIFGKCCDWIIDPTPICLHREIFLSLGVFLCFIVFLSSSLMRQQQLVEEKHAQEIEMIMKHHCEDLKSEDLSHYRMLTTNLINKLTTYQRKDLNHIICEHEQKRFIKMLILDGDHA